MFHLLLVYVDHPHQIWFHLNRARLLIDVYIKNKLAETCLYVLIKRALENVSNEYCKGKDFSEGLAAVVIAVQAEVRKKIQLALQI